MELVPGRLYRAISSDDVVELQPPQFHGLKLLVLPRNIKRLKVLQKAVEKISGHRPDLMLVLNAVLFAERELAERVPENVHMRALSEWIDELKQALNPQQ